MQNVSYLQQPSIHQNTIVFVTDDDIWKVSSSGGEAIRLTTSKGKVKSPRISPDGSSMVYMSNDFGQFDIYFMPLSGGIPQRLTFRGVNSLVGFLDSDHILFHSSFEGFHPRAGFLYKMNLETLEMTLMPYGTAKTFHQGPDFELLGMNIGDPAVWKRYRGGTAGKLWVKTNKKFSQILKNLDTNLGNPRVIDSRIFFISDHEGVGNIYSVNKTGRSLTQHSFQTKYYVRNFSHSDGKISYQAGGEIFILDLKDKKEEKIFITTPSNYTQSQARFEPSDKYLQEFNFSSGASKIAVVSRGQLYHFKPWSGAAIRLGTDQFRYKGLSFLNEDQLFATEYDPSENKEGLVLADLESQKITRFEDSFKFGKIQNHRSSSNEKLLAFSNNRNQLFLLDIKKKTTKQISKASHGEISNFDWSPCGRYLTYAKKVSSLNSELYLFDTKEMKEAKLFNPVFADFNPRFSSDGNYLFFLSIRDFEPHYSEAHFDIGFPRAVGIYGVSLNNQAPDLSLHLPDFDQEPDEDDNEKDGKKKKEKEKDTNIELKGIGQRIFRLPLSLGGYGDLEVGNEKLFFTQSELTPAKAYASNPTKENLFSYCLKDGKKEVFDKDVHAPLISDDKKYLMYLSDGDLRVVGADQKPTEEDTISRKDGWIDLEKVKIQITPKIEWSQMYKEAWLLQKENFWRKDMDKVNWSRVLKDYLPLLDKVHTRGEFSDLIWEMQGELGTSHCYEFDGDYFRKTPPHTTATLGASFTFNSSKKSMVIEDLNRGDSWLHQFRSPLISSEASLEEGDEILAIDGVSFENSQSLDEQLVNKVNQKVMLKVKRKGKRNSENISVYTLKTDILPNYRDWIESNKEYVHRKSRGKIGYVYVPDMGVDGFSEFYRHYLTESTKEGLIVDVRYNGGGHVSQLLLKILAQKVVGFDESRHMGLEAFPFHAVNGPITCLTNEHAGSDGDIFSHTFKLMNLGKLIGKRTWGGVVGIWPRSPLVDGSITTQPEFSFWFKDVGFKVENYGTDPDIEVDITPEDWAKNQDPQLDRAISETLTDMKKKKPLKISK